jgi:hypothetical protein
MKAYCIGFPGAMWCHSTRLASRHLRMAIEVNSMPLSETIVSGLLRAAMIASSSRPTRSHDSEVSATSARHSRAHSLCQARPSVCVSPRPACGRREGAFQAFPRDAVGTASCDSKQDLPVWGAHATGDTQSAYTSFSSPQIGPKRTSIRTVPAGQCQRPSETRLHWWRYLP